MFIYNKGCIKYTNVYLSIQMYTFFGRIGLGGLLEEYEVYWRNRRFIGRIKAVYWKNRKFIGEMGSFLGRIGSIRDVWRMFIRGKGGL